MTNISIVGTGYVGLVTGACFAEMGVNVICMDIDESKIDMLKRGEMPIYEPGIKELVDKNVKEGRLSFTSDIEEAVKGSSIIFSAVGTPADSNGNAYLQYVFDVAKGVGRYMTDYILFVTKSTVPVGTSMKIKSVINQELEARGVDIEFDIASNPEFLKEGAAIKDFMSPDRVVIGVENSRAAQIMERLYKPFVLNGYPIILMDIQSSEMTKYAANAMLATRISFMNEIAALCEMTGANIDFVRKGIGSDRRIGHSFLYAGAGYGGSCFPKDVKALLKSAKEHGVALDVVEAVERVNNRQKEVVFDKLSRAFDGDLSGVTVAIWGLSFKPDTDDMREAPSITVINKLIESGATVRVFDPVAMEEAKSVLNENIIYCTNIYETVSDADALALLTEWKQFRLPSWSVVLEKMRGRVIVDGRNVYNRDELEDLGFEYFAIGK